LIDKMYAIVSLLLFCTPSADPAIQFRSDGWRSVVFFFVLVYVTSSCLKDEQMISESIILSCHRNEHELE
jgi:hypothetical protein